MSDPDEQLSSFDPGLPMNPLPPTEVRRQGDRLRRRNTVMAGVGAALAVALIATPIAALSDRDEGPEPAPGPNGVDWVTAIPADFPLADGMPADAIVSDERRYGEIVISTVQPCGSEVWSSDDARDLLGAVWSDRKVGGEQRTLAVYADGADAEATVRSIEEEIGGGCSLGNQHSSTDVTPLFSDGALGWVEHYVRRGEPNGARVWQLTLVGNALLLDHTFVADPTAAVTEQTAQTLVDGASGVVEAMCVFTPEGCAGESEGTESIPPDPEAVTEIPDGIDITTGMAENESGEPVVATPDDEGVAEMVICDVPLLLGESAPLDRLAAHSSGPEYSDGRELLTYGSVDEARTVIDNAVRAAESCPTEDTSPTSTWVHQITDASLGDEAYTISRTYRENGDVVLGGTWWHVVRVGNAIFVSSGTGEAFPGADFDKTLEQDADDLAQAVESFQCFFSNTSCSSEAGEPPSSGVIPDDFPLAAGWPENSEGGGYGLEGPGRDVELLGFSPCGVELPKPISNDSLRAQWSNVEDNRSRELVTFADADEAVAYMAESREFFEGCPQDEIDSQGFQSFWRVIGTEVGGESYAVGQTSEFDGAPAVGMQVLHFIRVGHSVLIDTTANEGGAGPDPVADIARQIDEQRTNAAEVVAAMCLFTDAGC